MNSSEDKPLVSIITPTLNSERYIRDNIMSILSQTYPAIEHIIIDGGSTDKTLEIVRNLDPKAVLLSGPDEGISDAFNKGLARAKGDIVAFLNSDDYYAASNVIERIVAIIVGNPEASIVYGKVRCVEPETGATMAIYYSDSFSLKKMLRKLIISHPATFMTKKVYNAVGTFSLQYKICMDHDYLLRAVQLYKPHAVSDVLTIMRGGGKSARNQFLGHREVYRILRSNGVGLTSALLNLAVRYSMTTISFALQRIGLTSLILFYRRQKGQL
jgi:glycosyltransferase involved in cell wall biosynthesis